VTSIATCQLKAVYTATRGRIRPCIVELWSQTDNGTLNVTDKCKEVKTRCLCLQDPKWTKQSTTTISWAEYRHLGRFATTHI